MRGHGDTFELLLENGLVSIVRAGADLRIKSCEGEAVSDLPLGVSICDAIPALIGLDEQILSLNRFVGRRIVMTNMALVGRDGISDRQDIVVIGDQARGEFVISITPSLGNDAVSVDREQGLRRRMELESRLADQARAISDANEALRQTNADLINFTRIISHDLKAPMRAIRYTADDIEASLKSSGDPAQIEALQELREQSMRLSQMVTGLLTYSRLEDKSMIVETVDTHALVRDIVRSMPRREDFAIEIVGEWPQIDTIGVLLDVVLRNLIDNAIKHHDRETGCITVLAERIDSNLMIIVSDDGPGIPMSYQEAVLRPFLQVGSDPGKGSGMGLSMVNKVVSDVGGRIDVGNRLDGARGTRIAVSWPLTIKA